MPVTTGNKTINVPIVNTVVPLCDMQEELDFKCPLKPKVYQWILDDDRIPDIFPPVSSVQCYYILLLAQCLKKLCFFCR